MFTIDVDKNIDIENTYIPPMLAQPFIENAIEHGFVDNNKIYQLTISIKNENSSIVYIIEDNGIGIEKSRELKKIQGFDSGAHKSLGMQITKERLVNLKRIQKQKIDLKIIDRQELNPKDQGTRIQFIIPIIKTPDSKSREHVIC